MPLPALLVLTSILASPSLAASAHSSKIGCELTVVLQCGVNRDGAAHDCKVVSEDPNSVGAAAAALAMAAQFRLPQGEPREQSLIPIHIQTGACQAAR